MAFFHRNSKLTVDFCSGMWDEGVGNEKGISK